MRVMHFVLWNNHQREWFKIELLVTDNEMNKLKKIVRFGNPGLLGDFWGKYFNFTLMVIVPDPFYQ